MVRAWYHDFSNTDKKHSHMFDPPTFVDLKELSEDTGLVYWTIDVDNIEEQGLLEKIKSERGYNYEDLITIEERNPNDKEKHMKFYKEHIHGEEEIRLVTDGSGYFDVRDHKDAWVRVEMVKGDMIVLPAGMYHRFTLDTQNHVTLRRFFQGQPVWEAIPRPADDHVVRKSYVTSLLAQ